MVSPQEFDLAKAAVQAAQRFKLPVDIGKVKSKIEQLMRGLPAEDEFMALAVWMGKCLLIHKLDQSANPLSSKDAYQVPDLLGIFDYEGRQIPVLIEVKTTKKEKLIFSNKYYKKLKKYSEATGLPVVIAWKIRQFGWWSLFTLEQMELKRTSYHMPYSEAMKNDLMTTLLGNLGFTIAEGARLTMVIEKERVIERDESGRVKNFTGTIRKFVPMNSRGDEIPELYPLMFCALAFVNHDVETKEDERFVYQAFIVRGEPRSVFSFHLLRAALTSRLRENEQPNYTAVLRDEKFPLDYREMLAYLERTRDGSIVESTLHIRPRVLPAFLTRN